MRAIPAGLLANMQSPTSSVSICWRVERKDLTLILGTTHDQDVVIAAGDLAGTYDAAAGITGSSVSSSSDLSVDNLEVSGKVAAAADLSIMDLKAADIEAGLFDDARVTIFMVDWSAPDNGQLIIRRGNIGAIQRTAEGRYTAELRGLAQRLRQNLVRSFSVTCDAELGDARCQFAMSTALANGTVDAVFDRSRFDATITGGLSGITNFIGGLVTWLTGDNAGFSMEVKTDGASSTPGSIFLYEPMPYDIQVGDTFTLAPACDKTLATCRDVFDNIVNFRGYGVLVPGRDKITLFGEV